MSHVTVIQIELKDLEALKFVCEQLGLEFREHQQTYRWYGTHIGDYGTLMFEIPNVTANEAQQMALEQAGNHEFSENHAEYEVQSVYRKPS